MTTARVVAGVAGVLIGLLHGSAVIGWLDSTDPDSPGRRVPRWARVAWVSATAVTVAGGVLVILGTSPGVAVMAAGLAVTAGLAILNGFFIHGRPTVSHHVIRIAVSASVVGLGIVGT